MKENEFLLVISMIYSRVVNIADVSKEQERCAGMEGYLADNVQTFVS
jgi:hypothetical protein